MNNKSIKTVVNLYRKGIASGTKILKRLKIMILLIPQVENAIRTGFLLLSWDMPVPICCFDWYMLTSWLAVGRLVAGGLVDAGFDDMVGSNVLETSQPAHRSSLHGDPVKRTSYFKEIINFHWMNIFCNLF